jgi:hypothetical protein
MNASRTLAVLFFAVVLSIPSLAAADDLRDGSSLERAILVEGDYAHSVDWEWNYLSKKFGGRGIPKEQALTRHSGRTYDRFVWGTAAGDKVVYFDVTRFAGQIFKKRTKSLEQLMKEMGIPIEKHK